MTMNDTTTNNTTNSNNNKSVTTKNGNRHKKAPKKGRQQNNNTFRPDCLDPTVTLPSSLTSTDLEGCQDLLEELARTHSAAWQEKTLTTYHHMLSSVAGQEKIKKSEFTDQRRRTLLTRCLKRTTKEQQQQPADKPVTDKSEKKQTTEKPEPPKLESPKTTTGLSLSDTIRAAAQTSTVTLPGTKIQLEPSTAAIFHALRPDWQSRALRLCDEAARTALQEGNKVPQSLFVSVLQQTPVTLPKTKFTLEQSAAVLFHTRFEGRQEQDDALAACDQAALHLIQKGSSIQKPVEFFTTVLQKLQQNNNKTKATTTTPTIMANNNKQIKSTTVMANTKNPVPVNPTTPTKKGGILVLGSSKKSNNSKPKIQLLQKPALAEKNHRSQSEGIPNNSSPSSSQDAATIAMLREQLDLRAKQCQELEKKTKDLTKLWEAEKYSVGAYKERLQTLETSIARLQQQLKDKDGHVQEELQLAHENRAQEQAEYKNMVHAFTKLSQELCHAQEGKRELEDALEAERAMTQEKNDELQRLQHELKRSEMLRPTPRNSVPEPRRVQALQRELRRTQEKLAKLTGQQPKQTSKKKPSLADFVVTDQSPPPTPTRILQRPSSSEEAQGQIHVLQPPRNHASSTGSSSNAGPNNLLECELPGQTLAPPAFQQETECQQQQQPSDSTEIRFHGIEKAYDESDDEGGDMVDDTTEIDFLLASFGEGELQVDSDERRVTRTLHLEMDRNHEVVDVHLILSMPEGYPSVAPLEVEASLAPEISPSVAARKVTMDALPDLVNVCRWEANGSIGSEALFNVFQTADEWVQNEWHGIQAKRLPADASGKPCLPAAGATNGSLQMARLLLSTHHLVDGEKINFVKMTASHYNLGGYIKVGYPGFILVEGLEDNCTFFVESLVQQRMKLRNKSKQGGRCDSATFSVAGKVIVEVEEEFEGERKLPKKVIEIDKSREGMECFREFCAGVELSKYID
ncbi:RWD domain containing [Seminavis robusta]|uniref:RWD domain containing n=1 Tax=Seminavis robusta TaxID=568900 RepID=A0A9N8DQK0_9STRA|nr:RWD domain containing [Seminavis robusta]|eukprot:Sro268_g103810.1 RWD domain containing (970) ;mRNA; r:72156-75065